MKDIMKLNIEHISHIKMYATLQGVALTSELPGPWGDQVWFLSAHPSHHLPLTLPIFILLYSLPQPVGTGGSKQERGPG